MLYMWWFWVETWSKKGRFNVMLTLMLLIELCLVLYEGSFQVYGLENVEMSWRMDKSSSLGIPMSPQEISNRYKRKSLGMPPRHPLFIGKNQVTSQHTLFLLLYALCIFLGASIVFSFQFCLVLFVAINGWTPKNSFGEVVLLFICQEHSVFHSYRFNECSLFLELRLAFVFHLDFCSDLVIFFYQGVF
jgi:hypothetical protein